MGRRAAATASLRAAPLLPWALSQSRPPWPPRGQIHLELQTALSLPGFSYCPHPGLDHSPQHCGPEGWEAVGLGAAEGCGSLSGTGERRCRASQIQTPCPKCRMKTLGLVLTQGWGELDGVFVRMHRVILRSPLLVA